ncbi:hypothetical protein [Rhizocola hellebori]|uniref:hypothetical protein n=1 Tax=Rhizocola hellebori TaxID=1392758 RepID=UPI001940F256|nr:hypothetical protein [Rhizocola hellebori]
MAHQWSSHWFNGRQLQPGSVLFSFERPFVLEAFSASHSQLLLVSLAGGDGLAGPSTRVDVLFKPVRALHLRRQYPSLTVRCATADEASAVVAQHPGLTLGTGEHVFVLNDGGGHVIALATGFYEDERSNYAPSAFAEGWVEPGGPPWRRQALVGIDRGLDYEAAATGDLSVALDGPAVPLAARMKVGTLYIVMLGSTAPRKDIPVDAFVTRAEAEEFLASESVRAPAKRWIETVRIAV